MKKLILLMLVPMTSFALETDQFLAATHELKDASAPISGYVNEEIDQAVVKINKKEKNINCAEVSDRVMTEIVGKYSISKISQFAKKSPLIERFPDDSLGDRDYIDISIYKDAGFPFQLGLIARTINVGGVYVGTDKLGHFALLGRNYFRRFQDELKKNKDELAAEKATVMDGIKTEVHILGYTLGGVLSFGDLEANYRGFMFARSLCEGSNPYLIKKENKWFRTDRRFDITEHINPKMDESYKPAFWSPRIWKAINPAIKDAYCDIKKNSLYIERISKYPAKIVTNRNDEYIKEYFSDKSKFDRSKEDITKLCD